MSTIFDKEVEFGPLSDNHLTDIIVDAVQKQFAAMGALILPQVNFGIADSKMGCEKPSNNSGFEADTEESISEVENEEADEDSESEEEESEEVDEGYEEEVVGMDVEDEESESSEVLSTDDQEETDSTETEEEEEAESSENEADGEECNLEEESDEGDDDEEENEYEEMDSSEDICSDSEVKDDEEEENLLPLYSEFIPGGNEYVSDLSSGSDQEEDDCYEHTVSNPGSDSPEEEKSHEAEGEQFDFDLEVPTIIIDTDDEDESPERESYAKITKSNETFNVYESNYSKPEKPFEINVNIANDSSRSNFKIPIEIVETEIVKAEKPYDNVEAKKLEHNAAINAHVEIVDDENEAKDQNSKRQQRTQSRKTSKTSRHSRKTSRRLNKKHRRRYPIDIQITFNINPSSGSISSTNSNLDSGHPTNLDFGNAGSPKPGLPAFHWFHWVLFLSLYILMMALFLPMIDFDHFTTSSNPKPSENLGDFFDSSPDGERCPI